MPKNRWLRSHHVTRREYVEKRGGSCAHKNHIGMYGVQDTVTTT